MSLVLSVHFVSVHVPRAANFQVEGPLLVKFVKSPNAASSSKRDNYDAATHFKFFESFSWSGVDVVDIRNYSALLKHCTMYLYGQITNQWDRRYASMYIVFDERRRRHSS